MLLLSVSASVCKHKKHTATSTEDDASASSLFLLFRLYLWLIIPTWGNWIELSTALLLSSTRSGSAEVYMLLSSPRSDCIFQGSFLWDVFRRISRPFSSLFWISYLGGIRSLSALLVALKYISLVRRFGISRFARISFFSSHIAFSCIVSLCWRMWFIPDVRLSWTFISAHPRVTRARGLSVAISTEGGGKARSSWIQAKSVSTK